MNTIPFSAKGNSIMPEAGETGRKNVAGRAPSVGVEWSLPGFCGNCRVTTSFGDLPLQALRKRDPLRTTDGRLSQVALVNRISLDEGFLSGNPDARPVRITAGAFGPGKPAADLIVSPQQVVDCGQSSYHRDFRMSRDLLDRPGIFRHTAETVTYYLFHCGSEMVVSVEGIAAPIAP
ncbi:MAG: Hint domain-containing protein [Rhodobacteraceae bacterium]|nr:Hint domain-containing protein [Paracoccaceae bacterium]